MQRLRSSFTKEGILKARAIEKRRFNETWFLSDYDLAPKLKELKIPTLVIHGAYDFIPVECAAHIAQAIPEARFVVSKDTGHFSYIESPKEVRTEIDDFFQTRHVCLNLHPQPLSGLARQICCRTLAGGALWQGFQK